MRRAQSNLSFVNIQQLSSCNLKKKDMLTSALHEFFYFFFPKKCLIKQSTSMYIFFKKVKYIVGKCKKNELQNDKWRLARLAAFVGI